MKPLSPRLLAFPLLLILFSAHVAPAADTDADAEEPTAGGPWISSVAWIDDGHLVGTQSQGLLLRPATVVRVAVDELDELETVGEAETSLWSVQPVAEGKFLASDYKGGLATYGSGDPVALEVEARWIRALEKSPEADQWLAGTEDGKLLLLSMESGKEVKRIDASAAAIFDIAIHPAGNQVAIGSGDGTIGLFSWPELEPQATMSRGPDAVWGVVYSADGSRLISGGADRHLQLWDVAEARSLLTLMKTPDWVTSLVHLPDTTLVVAGCMDGSIVVADYEALIPVTQTEAAGSGIWSLALSPSGQQLAAGTRKHGFVVLPVGEWPEAGKAAAEAAKAERPPVPVKP